MKDAIAEADQKEQALIKQVKNNQRLVELEDEEILADSMEAIGYEWRRLPKESIHFYNYFKTYLNLPPPRDLRRVAKKMRVNYDTVRIAAIKNRWRVRADAFDQYQLIKEVELKQLLRDKKELEWQERRETQREREYNVAEQMLQRCQEMLNVPFMRETITERIREIDKNGNVIVEVTIINEPVGWKASDIATYFETAGKMARMAIGMDTDRKKLTIDVANLTDDELDNLANSK